MAHFDVIVIGGGAAGFYGAIHIAAADPGLRVAILERGKKVLSKVKVSGGGRCNVTHAQYDPRELTSNYPRGEKELLGPFHSYATRDTVAFFEERGIPLKTEADGRVFPVSNSSQTIIDCFLRETLKRGISLLKNTNVVDIIPITGNQKDSKARWKVQAIENAYTANKVLVATGSSPRIWQVLRSLGHHIESPVPSLFTFNIADPRIEGIQGVSTHAKVSVIPPKSSNSLTVSLKSKVQTSVSLEAEGPLLITHWGMSGPAVLKLSAWGAHDLYEYGYKFRIRINWVPEYFTEGMLAHLMEVKEVESRKTILRTQAVNIPRRLWINLVSASGIPRDMTWADVSKSLLDQLARQLTAAEFTVDGKSTFKEEFVTAGGVDLTEINFKTFESKLHPDLYFAGEVINVDAITGGFNFQNAWTGAYIAAKAIVR